MMGQPVLLSDYKGFYALPGVASGHPVNGSSQQLTNVAADTNTTATVVAGKSYLVTAVTTGGFILGLATQATAANVMWVVPLGESRLVHIDPIQAGVSQGDNVTLHYATDTSSGIAYLVELAEHGDN
jgi:hypothetical protein